MKNNITNSALLLIAFVAVCLLMSFARPMVADEPKQYIVVFDKGSEKFEADINQKLSEGWHLQGGVSVSGIAYIQAKVK